MNEIMAKTLSFGINGVNGFPVTVEVFGINGIPGMEIIGLPDTSVRESKDRVNAAIINSGRQMQPRRITINLAPADTKKEGPSFDLPIAIGILLASGEMVPDPGIRMDEIAMFGELSLDGLIQPISGVLPMVISAKEYGIRKVIIPAGNAKEVACIEEMEVFPAQRLEEVILHLEGKKTIQPQKTISYDHLIRDFHCSVNMSQIRGQQAARRALEVAAAGGHNLMMVGVPGSGKTMLARALPGILPPLSFSESLETTRLHSICGRLSADSGLMVERPFCAPHHSASVASLIGGGPDATPGEVSLAHNGVLFLDELPEFSRASLEALRQPLEDGFVTVSRVRRQAVYQSSFMLVAAMNPCPCGYFGSSRKNCRCTTQEIRRYLDRISGPLLDRIDIQIEVDAVPVQEIRNSRPAESSETICLRVTEARKLQLNRYRGTSIHCNSQLDGKGIRQYCILDPEAEMLLHNAVETMNMSMRAYNRILKVARTIADLEKQEIIRVHHIAEAIQYRELDQKYWR